MTLTSLGLIAGDGTLPQEIIDVCYKQGRSCVVASVANGEYNTPTKKQFFIGEVGKIIRYFQDNDVKEIIMIGSMPRPDFFSLKVDLMGSILLGKIMAKSIRGTDNILRAVAEFLESKGFKIVGPCDFLGERMTDLVNVTRKPSSTEMNDITIGLEVLNRLGPFDVGQSVIIQDGNVLGVEAAEGTDELIKRCAKLRKKPHGGILVKIVKPSQDLRFDLPTIGPATIHNLQNSKLAGLAVCNNSIIAEKDKVFSILKDSKMFFSRHNQNNYNSVASD